MTCPPRWPQRSKIVYRDFPDVFDPVFEQDAADFASVQKDTVGAPAFLRCFLMNEPVWGFSSGLPAAGMLFLTPECQVLARFLKERYPDASALSAAWKIETSFDQIERGPWISD